MSCARSTATRSNCCPDPQRPVQRSPVARTCRSAQRVPFCARPRAARRAPLKATLVERHNRRVSRCRPFRARNHRAGRLAFGVGGPESRTPKHSARSRSGGAIRSTAAAHLEHRSGCPWPSMSTEFCRTGAAHRFAVDAWRPGWPQRKYASRRGASGLSIRRARRPRICRSCRAANPEID